MPDDPKLLGRLQHSHVRRRPGARHDVAIVADSGREHTELRGSGLEDGLKAGIRVPLNRAKWVIGSAGVTPTLATLMSHCGSRANSLAGSDGHGRSPEC